jgi:hypothetical protein
MAAAVAALALTLAACGSGDEADDAAGAVTSATAVDDTGNAADAPTSPPTSDGTAPATSPATEDATAPTPTDAAIVPDILQFSAPLVGGGTFDGAAVAGIPTAFWFWAPT